MGHSAESLEVFVSILPQKFMVEQVGGDRVHVSVLVGSGQSPATYEPTLKQMSRLQKALAYFQIGVPFEHEWMARLQSINPHMKVLDTWAVVWQKERSHVEKYAEQCQETHDPHVWTSQAGLTRAQAHTGAVTLIQRFGSAAHLTIHLHCLVLEGVYRLTDGVPVFQPIPAPTAEHLQALRTRIIPRLLKRLTRNGALIEEQGLPSLATPDADPAVAPLQAAACTYRIALGHKRLCRLPYIIAWSLWCSE